ncbi:unnamed protein product [Bemisia tabaci]|uniref:lysozyme n=1 Tax=Bemisia tabaci TaxID=7038 RepID=A0A678PLM7_BEMTA|nr:PREDICTED: lysozyme-like [Bemisia tabaci]ASZ80215.1 I-type lysozyme 1 [Bemisia tabaci]CAH0390633.1 unnamed protein product [Bemisia tabaci]
MLLQASFLVILVVSVAVREANGKFISNLSPVCMRCLCHASSNCNLSQGCSQGYCGPFFFNREYWEDAGRPTLSADDDPDRDQAFADCARDFRCAERAVENYMSKWGLDCNGDEVTDCDDYALIHFNGHNDCNQAIEGTNFGRRYATCRPRPVEVTSKDP